MKYYLFFMISMAGNLFSSSFVTPDDVMSFHRDGFLIKRDCFSSEEVQQMDEKCTYLIQAALDHSHQHFDPTDAEDQKVFINGAQFVYWKNGEGKISIRRIVDCCSYDPSILSILRSDKMVSTFFSLLQTSQIEQIIAQFHPKLPHDGVTFKKHRDSEHRKNFDPNWKDVLGNGSYAIGLIAVDPVDEENGGLVIDINSYPPSKHWEPQLIIPQMNPGDMLFMHPDILHWSGENYSTIRSRKTLLAGFCAFGANHKNYPGKTTNDVLTQEENSFSVAAAPWKNKNLTIE